MFNTMTKTPRGFEALETLPECECIFQFDETPAEEIGGFNTLLRDGRNRLYLANIERETLVTKLGTMPLSEADTSVLTAVTSKRAVKWVSRAWRVMEDNGGGARECRVDVLAAIIAAAM